MPQTNAAQRGPKGRDNNKPGPKDEDGRERQRRNRRKSGTRKRCRTPGRPGSAARLLRCSAEPDGDDGERCCIDRNKDEAVPSLLSARVNQSVMQEAEPGEAGQRAKPY